MHNERLHLPFCPKCRYIQKYHLIHFLPFRILRISPTVCPLHAHLPSSPMRPKRRWKDQDSITPHSLKHLTPYPKPQSVANITTLCHRHGIQELCKSHSVNSKMRLPRIHQRPVASYSVPTARDFTANT